MRNRKPIIAILIVYTILFVIGFILLLPYAQDQLFRFFQWNAELILPLFLLFLLGIVLFVSLIIYSFLRDNEKEGNIHFYSSDSTSRKQEYLEREIVELNGRLVATEDKWKAVYHLLLSSQDRQMDAGGVVSTARFLKGFGIDTDKISIKSDFAFVLTPFHPDFENTYVEIRETCQSLKLTAMRSDEEFIRTDILKHIIKNIVEARVIIANIDGRNANVFYELGIAHALNKPTILVSKVDSSVPFDVQSQYIILYNSGVELRTKLCEILLKVLTSNNN